MGHSLGCSGQEYIIISIMIRTIFIASVATLALAAPEADPALVYAGGLGLGYAGLPAAGLPLAAAHAVPHVPVVKSVVDTPAEVATEVTAHALPVAVGYHGLGYYGKRSADADPAILAGSTRVITAPTPLIHNPPVRTVVAAPALAYAGLPYAAGYAGYAGLPYAAHVIAKRDADADPQLIAGLPYHAVGYTGLPLAAAHAVPHVPVVKSVDVTPAEVATEETAHAVPVAVGYHGFGYYG